MENMQRMRTLAAGKPGSGPVVYWMSRDQRMHDNWALIHAQQHALTYHTSLEVVFCLQPHFLEAGFRQYDFMLRGLKELEAALSGKGIPFRILLGNENLVRYLREQDIHALFTDFDPLRIKRSWQQEVAEHISAPMYEVDAHNIVPCWLASGKKEYGARTLRPKLHRQLPTYLAQIPSVRPMRGKGTANDWQGIYGALHVRNIAPVSWLKPGENAAWEMMENFLQSRLSSYDKRNDPNAAVQSDLSPYLHFGMLSAQRVALEVSAKASGQEEAFLEQLIVRRELSDNFCYHEPRYDAVDAFPEWARATLKAHRNDKRIVYSLEQMELAKTDDSLWNACQREMLVFGKMHGYLRMYWAKKILEWSTDAEEALKKAILLNDRYELDGRDPNGYAGIAWAMGGVHDRPWPERPVFGKIRYMNFSGARRKFNVEEYINRMNSAL